MIEDGKTVSLEYTLKLEDGTQADGNVGGEPLVYEQGAQQILPALEQAIAGMEESQTKEVTLEAEQAFGDVNPDLRQEVESEVVPEEARREGAQLVSEDPSGNRRLIRVHEVRDDKVVLDLNHPLAGQKLHFDVKVLKVE